MKLPAALVAAVLVWSSARYLPPYFLELRKMDAAELKAEIDAARQIAMVKELRAHLESQKHAGVGAESTKQEKRFY